jgi:GT2 family glycosyltransferase
MMPKVAIVYLSYNGKRYLDEALTALRDLNYPKNRLELIFVDNASQDGSQAYLKTVQGITFFSNDQNLGFAEGNNVGMRYALEQGADYIFLHNNDLKLDPNAIVHAVTLAESDSNIGSVQSLMFLWKRPDVINSTGGMIHFLGFGFARDNGKRLEEATIHDGEEIVYASGAVVLYRSSALKTVGMLDSFLFLYHEDLELGWRMRLAGFKNVLSVQSKAYHDYEFKRSMQKFFWMERNRWVVLFSYLKWQTLLLLLPVFLLTEFVLLLFAINGGWLKQKGRVYASLLSPGCWRYIARKRRESRAIRQVDDRKIVSLFTSRVEHQETQSWFVDKIGNPISSAVWILIKNFITW